MEKQYYLITGKQNNELNLIRSYNISVLVNPEHEGVLLPKDAADSHELADTILGYNPQIISLPTDPSGSL